jgi:hypothetical protein
VFVNFTSLCAHYTLLSHPLCTAAIRIILETNPATLSAVATEKSCACVPCPASANFEWRAVCSCYVLGAIWCCWCADGTYCAGAQTLTIAPSSSTSSSSSLPLVFLFVVICALLPFAQLLERARPVAATRTRRKLATRSQVLPACSAAICSREITHRFYDAHTHTHTHTHTHIPHTHTHIPPTPPPTRTAWIQHSTPPPTRAASLASAGSACSANSVCQHVQRRLTPYVLALP